MSYLRMNALSLFIISLLAFIFICIIAVQPAYAASGPKVPAITNVKGNYGTVIRETTPRRDGKYHVDTPATIARAQELNVNTFAFLMWMEPAGWTSTFTDQNVATNYGGPKRGSRVFNIIKAFFTR